jgi:hypothetical protein
VTELSRIANPRAGARLGADPLAVDACRPGRWARFNRGRVRLDQLGRSHAEDAGSLGLGHSWRTWRTVASAGAVTHRKTP